MFAAKRTTPEGEIVIALGLSDNNCEQLLMDRPIVFSGERINLPELWFAIARRHEDCKVGLPPGLLDSDKTVLILPLSEQQLAGKSPPEGVPVVDVMITKRMRVLIFRAPDERVMMEMNRQFTDCRTKVTIEGFPPNFFPPCQN